MGGEKLSGITFFMNAGEWRTTRTGKTEMKLEITATVEDQEQFEKIKKKFEDGFVVHTIEDFKGHMLQALRQDNALYTQQVRDLEVKLLNMDREKTALEEQLARLRSTLNYLAGLAR